MHIVDGVIADIDGILCIGIQGFEDGLEDAGIRLLAPHRFGDDNGVDTFIQTQVGDLGFLSVDGAICQDPECEAFFAQLAEYVHGAVHGDGAPREGGVPVFVHGSGSGSPSTPVEVGDDVSGAGCHGVTIAVRPSEHSAHRRWIGLLQLVAELRQEVGEIGVDRSVAICEGAVEVENDRVYHAIKQARIPQMGNGATVKVGSYQWSQVTDEAAFAPRDGAGALCLDGRMWLLGGWNPGDKVNFPTTCNSEIWSSTDGADWTAYGHAPWEGRHTAGYAVHDGAMWIVGGDANQRHYQNDVWCSENGTDWELRCEQVPWAPRALHYTVAFDGALWVMGGQSMPAFGGGRERFYNDVWRSVDGVDWTCVCPQAPWPGRGAIGGAAIHDGRIWLLGGGRYDTPTTPQRAYWNDVWSTADGSDWTCHNGAADWYPRMYHEVTTFDGRLWVLEGWHEIGANRNDVWYSMDGVAWEELPDTPWAPRHAASLFVYDGALWVVTGNNMESDVWKLTRKGG